MSLSIPIVDPSPITGLSFFDDFLGASYDDEVWELNGVTVVSQNAICGRVLVSGANGELRMGNLGFFQPANNPRIKWGGILTPGSGTAECGFDGAGNQGTEWICWIATGGFFQCQSGSGGANTLVSSGVAVDANDHIFEIQISTGLVQFFLDGVFKVAITTNVTTSPLQPYVWLTGTGSMNACYVLAQQGVR